MTTIEKRKLVDWFNSDKCPLKRSFVKDCLGISDSYICIIFKDASKITNKKAQKLNFLKETTENYFAEIQHVAEFNKKYL